MRHGQPEWVRDGLNVDNPPLTERGHRQADAMAQFLAEEHFDEILVSPMIRARQTAAPLYRVAGRDEVIAHWLEEIRNPMWGGTPEEKASEAFATERSRPSGERWTGLDHLGGEHVGEFVARIREGCGLFFAERGIEPVQSEFAVWSVPEPDKRIALVAHAGTNAVIICHLLGLAPTPWEWDRFVINHASVTRLRTLAMGDGYSFALRKLSDVEFLAHDDRTS